MRFNHPTKSLEEHAEDDAEYERRIIEESSAWAEHAKTHRGARLQEIEESTQSKRLEEIEGHKPIERAESAGQPKPREWRCSCGEVSFNVEDEEVEAVYREGSVKTNEYGITSSEKEEYAGPKAHDKGYSGGSAPKKGYLG